MTRPSGSKLRPSAAALPFRSSGLSPFSATGSPTAAEGGVEQAARILELHRLLDLHVQDAAGDRMHVDVEPLHARRRSRAGRRPGRDPRAPTTRRAPGRSRGPRSGRSGRRWRRDAGGVERVAGDDDAVDEGRLRRRGAGGGERGDGEREDERTKLSHAVSCLKAGAESWAVWTLAASCDEHVTSARRRPRDRPAGTPTTGRDSARQRPGAVLRLRAHGQRASCPARLREGPRLHGRRGAVAGARDRRQHGAVRPGRPASCACCRWSGRRSWSSSGSRAAGSGTTPATASGRSRTRRTSPFATERRS